jgi:hypothetical protein
MSTLRRSPRLVEREQRRALQETLQERLEQMEYMYGVKDGWITKMMEEFIQTEEEKINTPIRILLSITPTEKNIRLFRASLRAKLLVRDRELEELEDTFREMLGYLLR